MADKEEKERLRMKHLKETDTVSTKSRFGLFSQPPPLAIGDDSYFFKKLPERDEMNKPATMPKNPCSMALKKGKDPSVYFERKIGYTTIGDLYMDPQRKDLQYELEKKKKITNESIFKPASGFKVMVGATYEHKTDYKEVKKNYKDQDGRVITKPTNMLAGINKSQSLYIFPKHMPDPYQKKTQKQIDEEAKHRAIIADKSQFKQNDHGNRAFKSDLETFGLDQPMPKKKEFQEPDYKIVKHDVPFKPSNPPKKGLNGFLGKYPEYKGDPIRVIKRIDKEPGKEVFKPNNGGKTTRPTPTITCNPINIRREMSRGYK